MMDINIEKIIQNREIKTLLDFLYTGIQLKINDDIILYKDKKFLIYRKNRQVVEFTSSLNVTSMPYIIEELKKTKSNKFKNKFREIEDFVNRMNEDLEEKINKEIEKQVKAEKKVK